MHLPLSDLQASELAGAVVALILAAIGLAIAYVERKTRSFKPAVEAAVKASEAWGNGTKGELFAVLNDIRRDVTGVRNDLHLLAEVQNDTRRQLDAHANDQTKHL